ncbi:hypothetical protein BOTCAL_0013g00150 [Botryotinia calthae]|uniref:Uncharacterized protein n=1 Tax=Botryotinia calthae TaxID=38488 RepID=A0A4Y8DI60_9HELO|nr:hypothetical protein BOTCAL_0013g00150 [Botryotinia calthae]
MGDEMGGGRVEKKTQCDLIGNDRGNYFRCDMGPIYGVGDDGAPIYVEKLEADGKNGRLKYSLTRVSLGGEGGESGDDDMEISDGKKDVAVAVMRKKMEILISVAQNQPPMCSEYEKTVR